MTTHLGFQTEIEFELPKGYVDESGTLHRRGTMRLATAADEILPLRDPRVQQNEAYLAVIVLSRVVTKLGSLTELHTGVIECLFAADLAYLQRLYERFNSSEPEEPQSAPEHSVPQRLRATDGKQLRRFSPVGES
jgi:hypothetical protein